LFLAAIGRFDEAFGEAVRAQELDPLSLPMNANFGWVFYLARKFNRAIEQCLKTIEMESSFALAHRRLGEAYQQAGLHTEAIEAFDRAIELAGTDAELLAVRGHLEAKRGEQARARQTLATLHELSKSRYVPAYLMAKVHIGLGEIDETFKHLNKAYLERYGYLAYLKVDPIFDPIKADARFDELAARMKLG
jgi:serine/threonine-protein kinase